MLIENILKQSVFCGLMALFVAVSHCLCLNGTAMAEDEQEPTLSLDTTFSNDGIQTIDILGNDLGADITIGPNGTIIIAGISNMYTPANEPVFIVSRFLSNGLPDNSFGTGGQVSTTLPGTENRVSKVVSQADGKILVAGSTGNLHKTNMTLIRYTATGELDTTFSTDGIMTVSDIGTFSTASGLALQDDGKVILAGNCLRNDSDFCMIRLQQNGTPDFTFGAGGIVYLDMLKSDFCHALALQSDGKILLGGRTGSTDSEYNIALARFNSNGQLDTTFGHLGRIIKDIGSFDAIYALDIQKDGKIIAAGKASGLMVARYNVTGHLDSSFGSDGILIMNRADNAQDVAIQKDGKIITVSTNENDLLRIGRILPTGAADTDFASGGVASYNLGSDNTKANGVVIQPDGDILVAGSIKTNSNWDMLIIRLREQSTSTMVPILSLLLED